MINEYAEAEWVAWQEVCAELRLLGIDINAQDILNKKIYAWAQKQHEWLKSLGK